VTEFQEARKHDYRLFIVLLRHSEVVVRECPYCWAMVAADRYIDHVCICEHFPQIR
jgi:hypothetical protein